MKRISKYIKGIPEWRIVKQALALSKRLVLPGFDGIPLYNVAVFFIRGLQKGSLTMRASAVSFDFFMALFPSVLFFFTLIPYLPIPDFHATLMDTLENVMPQNAFETIRSTLDDILTRPRTGLLSIGFILALYFSTNGIASIMEAFKQTYYHVETRSFMKQRLISLFLVFVMSVLLITTIIMIATGNWVLTYLENKEIIRGNLAVYLLVFSKWIVIVALILTSISFLYYFAPSYRKRFRFFSAGSSLATVMFLLASVGFNYYVNNFARYNALYGSIGTLIVFLLWIYFNNIVLLIGYELNVSIRTAKKPE